MEFFDGADAFVHVAVLASSHEAPSDEAPSATEEAPARSALEETVRETEHAVDDNHEPRLQTVEDGLGSLTARMDRIEIERVQSGDAPSSQPPLAPSCPAVAGDTSRMPELDRLIVAALREAPEPMDKLMLRNAVTALIARSTAAVPPATPSGADVNRILYSLLKQGLVEQAGKSGARPLWCLAAAT